MIALRVGALQRLRGEMTQAELATKAGISRSTILRIENGQVESVTFGTVNAIAEALGIDADMLVTFDKEPAMQTIVYAAADFRTQVHPDRSVSILEKGVEVCRTVAGVVPRGKFDLGWTVSKAGYQVTINGHAVRMDRE